MRNIIKRNGSEAAFDPEKNRKGDPEGEFICR